MGAVASWGPDGTFVQVDHRRDSVLRRRLQRGREEDKESAQHVCESPTGVTPSLGAHQ